MIRLVWLGLSAVFLLATMATARSEPILPGRASGIDGFLPAGWTLSQKSEGDLNRDRLPDAVLVLCRISARNDCFLSVVFALPRGGYRLAGENHTLIPRSFDARMSTFSVRRRCLIAHFSEVGPGSSGLELEFTFRFQNGRFELIGFDRIGAGHGGYLAVSVDYLTGRAVISTGQITSSSDSPGAAHERKHAVLLTRRPLRSIEQVVDISGFDGAQLCLASTGLTRLQSFCPRRRLPTVAPAPP